MLLLRGPWPTLRRSQHNIDVPAATYDTLTRSEKVLARNFGRINPSVSKTMKIKRSTKLETSFKARS
jgi:hypothetical protein